MKINRFNGIYKKYYYITQRCCGGGGGGLRGVSFTPATGILHFYVIL